MNNRDRVRGIAALSLSAALLLAGTVSAGGTQENRAVVHAPETAAAVRAEPLRLGTWEGIPLAGTLAGETGADWDCVIGEPPEHGRIAVNGSGFTFTPVPGFTGVDRFTYTASDRETGEAALTGRATVFVGRRTVQYADMDGSPDALAAQELAEEGVYTGRNIGGRYYFGPDETLRRDEFLALAMEALGRELSSGTAVTRFCDDGAIPAWVRSYAAAGEAEGIIRGIDTALGTAFQGESPVTWSQAAAILSRSLNLEGADLAGPDGASGELYGWAAREVGNLEAAGVVPAGSFGSLTMEEAMTRAEAARLLSAARAALNRRS